MKEQGFERALAELEALVEELDRGELGLEQAIAKYEKAVGAYRKCRRILARARKRIEILVHDAEGEGAFASFEEPGGDAEPRPRGDDDATDE